MCVLDFIYVCCGGLKVCVDSCCKRNRHSTMPLDYRRAALFKRTKSFGDVRIGPCLVTGVVVENALKLEYLAGHCVLPKVLEQQTAKDHTMVQLEKVLAKGADPQLTTLHVPAAAAELAIGLARRVVKQLKGELGLAILAVDRYDDKMPTLKAGHRYAHDIVARRADGALVSVEIKVREVEKRKPKEFNWQRVLETEAQVLWDAVMAWDLSPWCGRVLVFVELPRPCHAGPVRGVHLSALWKTCKKWQTLCGWSGFWPRSDGDTQSSHAGAAPAHLQVSEGPSAAQLHRLGVLLAEQCVVKTGADDWIPLTSFLKAMKKHPTATMRRLSSKKWQTAAKAKPRVNREWKYIKGPRGGGRGDGALHCWLAYLRFIYWKCFVSCAAL